MAGGYESAPPLPHSRDLPADAPYGIHKPKKFETRREPQMGPIPV